MAYTPLMTNYSPQRKISIPQFSIPAIDLRKQDVSFIPIDGVHEFTSVGSSTKVFIVSFYNFFIYVGIVRSKLAEKLGIERSSLQLFHPNNPIRVIELQDSQTLRDLKIVGHQSENCFIQYSVVSSSPLETAQKANSNSKSVLISPASVGTSGVYFVEDANANIPTAVFKPYDEEQGMINNPKGFKSKPLKSFFEPGHGMIREYAAYLLDVGGFCKVPKTTLVRMEDESFQYSSSRLGTYPKLGALQEFVRNAEEISGFGRTMFTDLEIQKIALLDLRLLNCDRNDENVLVVRNSLESRCELVPIDHAYCLPAHLSIDCWDWFWFSYPQVQRPICPEIIEYFQKIDIDENIKLLTKEVSVSVDSLFLLKLVHHTIKKSIEKGLTLFDIASVVARTTENMPSPLEKMINEAEMNAYNTLEARSSRNNNHLRNEDNLSSSLETPCSLTQFPYERRNRSNTVSISQNDNLWNSPIRKVVNSSDLMNELTARLDNLDLSAAKPHSQSKTTQNMNQDTHDFDSTTTDDSTISTISSIDANFERPFGAPIRDLSAESYFAEAKILRPSLPLCHVKSLEYEGPSSTIYLGRREPTVFERTSSSPGRVGLIEISRQSTSEVGYEIIYGTDIDSPSPEINCTSDEGESLYLKDIEEPTISMIPYRSNLQSTVIRRMVSFAAIPSAPMYDYNSSYEEKLTESLAKVAQEPFDIVKGRRVPKKVLQQQVSHESLEFQDLRQHFAETLVGFLLKRINPKH